MGWLSGLFGSDAPPPPDPEEVSAAEYKYGKMAFEDTLKGNAIDRYGPTGSTQWIFDPVTGMPIGQKTTLNPEQQALLDAQTASQTGISEQTLRALGLLPQEAFNFEGNRDDIAKASFDKQMALLRPEFENQQDALFNGWSDRGIPLGSEIYGGEQGRFDDARNNAMFAASRQALLDAGNELQRDFSMAKTEYDSPMQQLQALMGVSAPVTIPGYAPQAQANMQAPNHSQNVWNAYNAEVQQAQADNSNLFGLASTAMMFL